MTSVVFDAVHCRRCGRGAILPGPCPTCGPAGLDKSKVYHFVLEGQGLSARVPGDPVLWRWGCRSEAEARRRIPEIVAEFSRKSIPRDAVHRGLAREMTKGEEVGWYMVSARRVTKVEKK